MRPSLRDCLRPGSLARGAVPSNASSTPRAGSGALEPETSSRPLGDRGGGGSGPGAPAAQIARPSLRAGSGRPAGIAAICGEHPRKLTAHVLAFRALTLGPLVAARRSCREPPPRGAARLGAPLAGPRASPGAEAGASLGPELLNVASLPLCF